jgi:hypothetical protein
MDTSDFEANLVAGGYTEIETQNLQPRPGKGHGHHFAIRGLVLAGTFTVIQDNRRVTYGPGEIFAVAQDHPHDEEVGPEGARVALPAPRQPIFESNAWAVQQHRWDR